MSWKIPLFDLDYGDAEEQAVLQVLRSRWLTMGEVTQRFERAFAEKVGVRHAFAVANGTVALHLACAAAGLGRGDEVIVPALTFVATAACVRYVGARPVFADVVGPNDLTISPESIEKNITPKTRAIIVMHYAGYPCDMNAIQEIADRHHLIVIEDAAHAPGASLNGRAAGAWGSLAAFSFFSNKNLATGEGGMVVTNDDVYAEKLRRFRSHGMTSLTWDRHRGQAWSYDVTDLGYNYRPSEILSALGLAQLSKLDANNQARQKLTKLYHQILAEKAPSIFVPFKGHRGISSYHIMPIILPTTINRLAFMDKMKSHGVQTSIHYPIIPNFTFYSSARRRVTSDIKQTELIAPCEVTLPMYARMEEADVQFVCDALVASLVEVP